MTETKPPGTPTAVASRASILPIESVTKPGAFNEQRHLVGRSNRHCSLCLGISGVQVAASLGWAEGPVLI